MPRRQVALALLCWVLAGCADPQQSAAVVDVAGSVHSDVGQTAAADSAALDAPDHGSADTDIAVTDTTASDTAADTKEPSVSDTAEDTGAQDTPGPTDAGTATEPDTITACNTQVIVHHPNTQGLQLRGDQMPLSWQSSTAATSTQAGALTFVLCGQPAVGWSVKVVRDEGGKLSWQHGPNHVVKAGAKRHIWPYFEAASAQGKLEAWDIEGPTFGGAAKGKRKVRVFLPPGYSENTLATYPLLLMHDGQNVFEDKTAAFGVAWKVQDALLSEIAKGKATEVVVAAVDNGGAARIHEYTPVADTGPVAAGKGGGADALLDWYEKAVISALETKYRLKKGRQYRVIGGSSLGGLLSMHALVTRPGKYLGAMAMSGSWWWAKGWMFSQVAKLLPLAEKPVKVWIDSGSAETGLNDAKKMKAAWLAKGYKEDVDVGYMEHLGGQHSEKWWKARVHLAIRFFFDPGDRLPAF